MQIPKFRDYITEQNPGRKDKPITIAILTINDSEDPQKDSTVELIEKACKKQNARICFFISPFFQF